MKINYQIPITPPLPIKEIENFKDKEKVCLSKNEKVDLENWLSDYKIWKEKASKINYVVIRRQKDASLNLSMILIGLPLYLYHWLIIKKETKNKGDD